MKVITWNSQGYKLDDYKSILIQQSPDVLLVQECGTILHPKEYFFEEAFTCWETVILGTQKKPKLRYKVAYLDLERDNNRCSMVMFIKSDWNINSYHTHYYDPKTATWDRPLLGVEIEKKGERKSVFTTHLPSGSHQAFRNAIINNYLEYIDYNYRDFIFAGDFNTTPSIAQEQWIFPNKAIFVYFPDTPTHHHFVDGKEFFSTLDYAIIADRELDEYMPTITAHPEWNLTARSDHFPVLIEY